MQCADLHVGQRRQTPEAALCRSWSTRQMAAESTRRVMLFEREAGASGHFDPEAS